MENYKVLGISMVTFVFFFFWAMSFVKEINMKFHFSFFFLIIALASVVEIIAIHLAHKSNRKVINASVLVLGINIPTKVAIFAYLVFSGLFSGLAVKIFLLNRIEITFFVMAHIIHVSLIWVSFMALCVMFCSYLFLRRDSILENIRDNKNS